MIVDATAAEAKTPEYSAAQKLQSIVEGVINQIEYEQTLSGSMVPRAKRNPLSRQLRMSPDASVQQAW